MEPKFEGGIWKCPFCNFTAMSKKVVEMHMQREHKDLLKKEKHDKKQKQKKKTAERLPPWGRDYVSEWCNKKVKIKLANGEELIGTLFAEPEGRYAVKLQTVEGRKLIINKGSILYYELLD